MDLGSILCNWSVNRKQMPATDRAEEYVMLLNRTEIDNDGESN